MTQDHQSSGSGLQYGSINTNNSESYHRYERSQVAEAKTARELELEALLRSACAIAERQGEGTNWGRFIDSVKQLGLNGVTARTYRILESDKLA